MSSIKEQILAEVGNIRMDSRPLENHQFYNNSLRVLLNSKEVRHIAADEKDEILGWEPTALLPEYETLWKTMPDDVQPTGNYEGLKDGYDICELFVDSRRMIVTADYLKYIKATKSEFVINVYGHSNTLISRRFWAFCDHPDGRDKYSSGKLPPYEFAKPEMSFYNVIGESKYWDSMYIESCQDPMAVLAMDLPHKYYSTQNLKGHIFTWDIATEKYEVGGKSMAEIGEIINRVARFGIEDPLVFRINEGCLTPVDNDTAIMLFVATYLNLPTIPVVLFMSDDKSVENKGYEELHDVLHSDFWHNATALEMVNNIVKPYMFFELLENGQSHGILKAGDSVFAKSQYPAMSNIDDKSLTVIDRYLDTKAEPEDVQLPMTSEELAAKKATDAKILADKTIKEAAAANAEIVKRILAGDFAVKDNE